MKIRFNIPILLLLLFTTINSVHAAAAPTFSSTPTTSLTTFFVGVPVIFCVAATDPQGLPLATTYDYGDSSVDALGKHVYSAAGLYIVTITVSNGSSSVTTTLSLMVEEFANLWIKKQSIKTASPGKQTWQAQYIYNADRTLAKGFNPATDVFIASLGTVPILQIPGSESGPQKFLGTKPKFNFKSAKGTIPNITAAIDVSSQTITINAKSETFPDKVPGIFHNMVQLGNSSYFLDQFFDAKGNFTANSGYRSTAFVVSSGSVKIGKPGKDSVVLSLLLADPGFVFPAASGSNTVRIVMTSVVNQVLIDKDLTKEVSTKAGKLKAGKDSATPAGTFGYDPKKGKMSFGLSKANLTGLLGTSEEHVRVDVTLGSKTYTTHVTLFAAKAGAYNTKLPKKFANFIPGIISDTTAPSVSSTLPVNSSKGVALTPQLSVTFSEAMNPATLSAITFVLQQGASIVHGAVSYSGVVATFVPGSALNPNTQYTATITTGATDVAGNQLACNYNFTFTTSGSTDTTAPTVVSTVPKNAAVGVAINTKINATFSEAMDASSLNAATFTVVQNGTAISGIVNYVAEGKTVTFTPSNNLASNSAFTATVSTGAKDLAGNATVANFNWTFATSATADNTAPTIISTNPSDQAANIAINHSVNATFDEAMDPATIVSGNFTVQGSAPGSNTIAGTVAYDAASRIATFTQSSDFAPNTQFTGTVTTGVKDLAGNALAVNKVWTFTTGTQQAVIPPPLGVAAPYGTFGGGAGMTSQGLFTVVNGDIGTTGASTTVTGFHDNTGDIYTETPLNMGQVNGRIYTAPPTPGGAGVGGTAFTMAVATQAASDAIAAYNSLSPASMPGGTDPGAGQLGGLTLPPGIYKAAGDTFQVTGSDLTLDAQGDSNGVWVFQMAASLSVGEPGAPRTLNLINGAQAKNVFWQVGSSATINAAGGGTMVGTIIASSGVTFSTAGNVMVVTLNGRALSLNASTTLVNTVINVPAP